MNSTCLWMLAVTMAAVSPMEAQDLPDGPGKAVIVKLCNDCHGVETMVGLRRTKKGWEKTVDEMASRGANGTDAEFEAVVNYLTRYLGKVNINAATSKEIQDVVDLTPAEADAIVQYRTKNGDFKDIDEIGKVPAVDAKKLAERKDRIAFQ